MPSPSLSAFNEFAHSIGVDVGDQARRDSLELLYEDEAELHVQCAESGELFAVLRRPVPDYKWSLALPLALQMCHWDKHLPFPVQASCKTAQRQRWLVFAVCISPDRASLTEMQQAVGLLRDLDKRMTAAIR